MVSTQSGLRRETPLEDSHPRSVFSQEDDAPIVEDVKDDDKDETEDEDEDDDDKEDDAQGPPLFLPSRIVNFIITMFSVLYFFFFNIKEVWFVSFGNSATWD